MMDHPMHAVVRFEPMNYSYSQHTTTTTVSRDNSLKMRKERSSEGATLNSIAQNLKKCTKKAFVFKANGECENPQQVVAVIAPNVSLCEVVEEEGISGDSGRLNQDESSLSNFYQIDSSS